MNKLTQKNMLEHEIAEAQAKKDIKKEHKIVLNESHIKTILNPIRVLEYRTLI